MIRCIITDAEKKKKEDGSWYIRHPSNDAILAYCDTEEEADDFIALLKVFAGSLENEDGWKEMGDKPLAEDKEISAAFPTRSHRHDLYATAMRMVGAKYSKMALVALVNYLLHKADKK